MQPIIASHSQAAGSQTYMVGEIADDAEVVSVAVGCINDLSVEGNRNIVHWRGTGESYRVYKSTEGVFGLIGTTDSNIFIDENILPDTGEQPPES